MATKFKLEDSKLLENLIKQGELPTLNVYVEPKPILMVAGFIIAGIIIAVFIAKKA